MADAKKEAAAEAPAKPKSKLLLIISLVVVLLLLIGGGVIFMLQQRAAAEAALYEEDLPPRAAKAKAHSEPGAPPVFSKLEPFIVKLQSAPEAPEAYVQAVPELKLRDATVSEQITQYMPELRHNLLLILAGKSSEELSSPIGMQALANQIRVSINASLTGAPINPALLQQNQAPPSAPVQAVFFSSIIVQ